MNNIPVFEDITKQEQFEQNIKNVLEIEKIIVEKGYN